MHKVCLVQKHGPYGQDLFGVWEYQEKKYFFLSLKSMCL
jgi:hypothetical protein